MNMLVSVKSAHAAPWGSELLSGINFDLDRGQVMGILGPNGAGKTSLLNLLCGSIALTQGEFILAGRSFDDWSIQQRARAMAVLPQQSSLNFPYTVEEVVSLGRTPHASGAAVDARIVDETLAATDISTLRHRLYTQLSGGEKQRVQLARVFAQVWREEDSAQRLLLLDEPTSALDLSHQKLIMQSVRRLVSQGCSAVLILHDFNLAARYTDRCVVLHEGTQWTSGTPPEVLTPNMFRQVFDVDAYITQHPVDDVPVIIAS